MLDARDAFEDGLLWRFGDDPGMRIFEIIADIVASWDDNPEVVGLLSVLIAENIGNDDALRSRLAENYRRTVTRLATTLSAAQSRGEMRSDVDPNAKAIEMLAFLSGLELAWLVSSDIPAEEAAAAWAGSRWLSSRSGADRVPSKHAPLDAPGRHRGRRRRLHCGCATSADGRARWRVELAERIPVHSKFWRDERAADGELLYVAIGDSAAQGIGASRPPTATWGSSRAALRANTDRPVRVVNLSVSGATVGLAIETQLAGARRSSSPTSSP